MSKKTTRKALFGSVLALVLCVAMLIGTTFAWFTDSVESGNNVIQSGNLDIVAEYWNDTEWQDIKDASDVLTNTLWEPGATEVAYLRLKNAGSLALKYDLGINIVNEESGTNVAGETFKLSDYIYYDVVEGVNGETNAYASREAALAVATENTKISTSYTQVNPLEVGSDYVYLAMVVHMPTSVGNEANHKTGTAAPTIDLGVNVFATQYTSEEDAFDKYYDRDAIIIDILATPETIDQILASVEKDTVIGLQDGYYDDIVLTQDNLTLTPADDGAAPVVGLLNLNAKDGAVIDGLTFDQTGAQQTYTFTKGNQVATGYVANITGDTNSPKAANGVVIRNCTFTNTSGVATVAADSYAPIYFNEQGAATERCDSITVENCVFACNATQYICLNYMAKGNVVINNNTFGSATYGTSHNTIQATGNAANWTITGNSFNNWNVEKTAIGSSKQGDNTVTWTITGNEFNHENGAVVLALKTTYTAENSIVTVANNTVLGGNGTIVTTDVNAENETVYGGHKIQLNDGVAMANSSEEMTEAINDGDTTIVLGTGIYILPDSAQGKALTISGTGNPEDTVIANQNDGSYEGCDYSLDGATVVFENITINTDGHTYAGYARCTATYNNCIINGTYTLYGDSVFNNCTFNISGDLYNIWTWGAPTATFNNCTFNSDGKAMLLYGTVDTKLTINNCVFNDNGGLTDLKAAIEIGNDYGRSYELIVNNTVVNGYEINDKGICTYTSLWANKNSMATDKLTVVVDNVEVYGPNNSDKIYIDSAEGLFSFANAVNIKGNNFNGKTVLLTADIDLNNDAWTPIGQTGATEFRGIFDGQNYTISNLYVDSSAQTGGNYSSGLFGWAESGVTIQNVKIDGASVTGNHNVAVIVGYTYSGEITNCHVTNANIVCNHANDDACGDKCGLIAGYAADESRITSCTATNSTVKAGRDAGQLVGCGYNVSISNCSATNVTVTATGECTGNYINEAIIGRVMG